MHHNPIQYLQSSINNTRACGIIKIPYVYGRYPFIAAIH